MALYSENEYPKNHQSIYIIVKLINTNNSLISFLIRNIYNIKRNLI